MSDAPLPPADDAELGDAADRRMADLLRGSSSGAELRRELAGDLTQEATDLRARLDALDFVQQVVGSRGEVPEQLGSYQIKGLLGRGGMGTVYLAWQQELEREVALKVLSPHYSSDPTMRSRFRAEARATAALHHRHIVPIYDYGEAQGLLFFAMERVDGMSLDKHIAAARRHDRRPLDPLDAARRFAGVADALGLAHRRRLLHRDVKPGNILVAADGTLALTDFGLAKALDQASAHLTSKGGGFLGTLHYSSPEQALGGDLSPASDLYSLGVTIFEAVAGELPVAGKTTEALLQSILHGTPRRLRDAVPGVPRDLDAVVEKLLAREPRDRYQDGEELARDLQRIADGEPVHIRRLPLHVRLWRRARKNPVLAGAIAAAALLLLVTVTLLTVLRRETGKSLLLRHQQALVAIAADIGEEAGAAHGPAPLLQALTGVPHDEVPPSEAVLRALQRAAEELPDDPAVAATRRAYVEDPLPAASALLREGRGHEARLAYDQAIAAAIAARARGELAVELRLYRLYLGRGIAALTAAVALPTEARTDLALASFLRPGALFPRAVLQLLDVAEAADPAAAVQQLERNLGNASAERRRVTALLLWALARLQPAAAANLMDFGLPFQARRAVHDLALRWLDGAPAVDLAAAGAPTGFAARLRAQAQEALRRLGESQAVRELAERGQADIDRAVHPGSPLQGWRMVLQLLRQPLWRGSLLDRDGRPLAPAAQLAGWEALAQLAPPQPLLLRWLPRFDELWQAHPSLPGMVRTAARLHFLAQSPEAPARVAAWIAAAAGDPEAQLCRLRLRLLQGDVDEALDDGMVAVQQSVAPEATLLEVVRACEGAAAVLGTGDREAALALAQSFRGLQGITPPGGRR